MAKIIYNKLIRDRIPEIIAASGKEYQVEVMPESDYREALREKLVEEAQEARAASEDQMLKELADIREVMDSLMREYGITEEMLREEQQRRHAERGGFEDRLKLLWTN